MTYDASTPEKALKLADEIMALTDRYSVAISLVRIYDNGVQEGFTKVKQLTKEITGGK